MSLSPDGSWEVEIDDVAADPTLEPSTRVLAPGADAVERAAEAALRPRRLADFVGQPVVREQLSLVLDAARARGCAPDHLLLSGPPGLGKTTLAMIVAAELRVSLRVTSGPAIQHAGDLVPRRNPPNGAPRRRDALHGDGGLPGRRHRR
jgi:Holliday junction DNA helicase RuvB